MPSHSLHILRGKRSTRDSTNGAKRGHLFSPSRTVAGSKRTSHGKQRIWGVKRLVLTVYDCLCLFMCVCDYVYASNDDCQGVLAVRLQQCHTLVLIRIGSVVDPNLACIQKSALKQLAKIVADCEIKRISSGRIRIANPTESTNMSTVWQN